MFSERFAVISPEENKPHVFSSDKANQAVSQLLESASLSNRRVKLIDVATGQILCYGNRNSKLLRNKAITALKKVA